MKKTLVSLAVIVASGSTFAQSNATVFGVVDATAKYGMANGAGSASKSQLGSGGWGASRFGFRGTEDLGGGLSASFWLEGTFLVDSGAGYTTTTNNQLSGVGPGLFDRRATVSLAGSWGELRLGRDYTPQFRNIAIDPFISSGVGMSLTMPATSAGGAGIISGTASTALRASNMVDYFLPSNLGGIYGQAAYYLGENAKTGAATEKDGTGYGVRIGYLSGPANIAVATSKTTYASGDVRQSNIGGSWSFGQTQVMGQYSADKLGTTEGRGWLLGTVVTVGAGEIKAAYSRYKTHKPATALDPNVDKLAVGYVHNLSKRTAVYTTLATVRNRDGFALYLNGSVPGGPNRNSTGVDLGLRHIF